MGRTRLRIAALAAATAAALALTACGSDENSWAAIEVDFRTADSGPSWSPDGKLVAFASNRDGGGIFVVPTNGRGIRRLTATKGLTPEWSPDGREIAFDAPDGVRVMSANGENERLVAPAQRTGEAGLWPVWSPDGKRLAFVRDSGDGTQAVYVVPRQGGRARRLLEPALSPDDPNYSILTASELTPSWSPDGKRIAYDSGDGVLVLADVATSERETIPTDGQAFHPQWSPDGSEIAFQCAGDLCVVDLATKEQRTLVGDAGSPSWSPDAKRIVVERYLYGAGGTATSSPMALYLVDTGEEGRTPLTFGPGEVEPD